MSDEFEQSLEEILERDLDLEDTRLPSLEQQLVSHELRVTLEQQLVSHELGVTLEQQLVSHELGVIPGAATGES